MFIQNDTSCKNIVTRTVLGASIITAGLLTAGCGGGHKTNPVVDLTDVRVIHASADAPKVKIAVDANLVEGGKSYNYLENTTIVRRNAGPIDLAVKALLPDGKQVDVITAKGVNLSADKEYEVFAIGSVAQKTLEPFILSRPDKFNSSNVRVSVAHLTQAAPLVDVYVTAPGANLASSAKLGSFAYKETLGPVEIPAGNYQIRVTASGSTTALYDSGSLNLKAGEDWVAAAVPNVIPSGAPNKSPIGLMLLNEQAQLFVPSVSDGASLRVVHNSADAPAVDIIANNQFASPMVKNLVFPNFTDYLTIPAANYNVKVTAAGTQTAVINADLGLANGVNYTVIALDTLNKIAPLVLVDNPRSISTEAQLRAVHGSSLAGLVDVYVTAPGVTINGINPAIKNFAFKGDSGYIGLTPGNYAISLAAPGTKTIALGPLDVSLDAGGIYTVLARDEVGLAGANVTLLDDFNP